MRGVQGESDNHPNLSSLTRSITQAFWRKVRNRSPFHHHILGQPVSRLAFFICVVPPTQCDFLPFSVCLSGVLSGHLGRFSPAISTLYRPRFSKNSAELLGASTRRNPYPTTACACVERTAFVAHIGFDASSQESNRDTRTFFRNRESAFRLAWLGSDRPIKDVTNRVGQGFPLQELADQFHKPFDVQAHRHSIGMDRHPVQHAQHHLVLEH